MCAVKLSMMDLIALGTLSQLELWASFITVKHDLALETAFSSLPDPILRNLHKKVLPPYGQLPLTVIVFHFPMGRLNKR